MRKDEIRNLLIIGNRGPKYYSENEERKKFFLELLAENFPYAIKMFSSAPVFFKGDKWTEYQSEHFKMIWPLYNENSSEETKRDYYAKTYEKLNDPEIIREILEYEIWKLSTLDLLYLYRKWHRKIKESKNEKAEIKNFHASCIEKLNKVIKQSEQEKKVAEDAYERAELAYLRADLISDKTSEDKKQRVKALLEKYSTKVFNVTYFQDISANYKSWEWLEVYLKTLTIVAQLPDIQDLSVKVFNSSVSKRISTETLIAVFKKNDPKNVVDIFEKIEDADVFDKLFRFYTKTYNKPDVVTILLRVYLDKFPYSGEAILNSAMYINEGRSSVNTLPDIIDVHSKKWLLSINAHNRTDEICNVLDALNSVNRLEELFYDFRFWKDMEGCNAFIGVIDAISYIVGFERCYEIIKKNYLTAYIYGENNLKNKWLQAANTIAVRYEDAQKPYVLFIGELIDNDSVLNDRNREALIKETIYSLLQQATDNRKLYDLQLQKNSSITTDYIQNVIFHICSPVEKLEKTLIGYSSMPGADEETLSIFRNQLAKIREALNKVGIHTFVDPVDWEKCKVVPFESDIHKCSEDIKEGEGVLCLSMGMHDEREGFSEKANVRLYLEAKDNGSNL